MSRVQIGRTVRRLRTERNLSQQALANRLGISASYLNLIEHDQRAVSGTLLIKLAEMFHLDLAMLSGSQERRLEIGLREAFSDPLLGVDAVPEAEIAVLAGSGPNAARAVLALYRAWRVAREDAGGIALPSGRRILLPNEEARDVFEIVDDWQVLGLAGTGSKSLVLHDVFIPEHRCVMVSDLF